MIKNNELDIKTLRRKIILTKIIGAPGGILLGLGLYGKFAAQGDAFIAILNNIQIVDAFLVAGAIFMIIETIIVIRLTFKISALKRAKV